MAESDAGLEPVEVIIIHEQVAATGTLKTFRGWICPECAAVVSNLELHAAWHKPTD